MLKTSTNSNNTRHSNNSKSNSRNNLKSAFSLIEISIVLLVISALIAGIIIGGKLVKQARIKAAQSLTEKSPIMDTENLLVWFEGSLDNSFATGQNQDGSNLNEWKTIAGVTEGEQINAKLESGGDTPIFANSINSVPAVKFNGNSSFTIDSSSFNDNDYTIMIVESRESDKSDNYLISAVNPNNSSKMFKIGYSANGQIIHTHGEDVGDYKSYIVNYNKYEGPRVLTFVYSKQDGKKTYINGTLTATSNNVDDFEDIDTLSIGKGYVGQIGELAVFKRAIDEVEIKNIESYLSQKWRVKMDGQSGSCIGGVVDGEGCDMSSCPINIAGVSKSDVSRGEGTLTCDKTGYVGNITYSCIDKQFSKTGECSCTPGYAMLSGTCQTQCDVPNNTLGIAPNTKADPTEPNQTKTLNCKAGYTGTIEYSCNNAAFFIKNNSQCTPICSISPAITGITKSKVNQALGTIDCDPQNYSGSISYSCVDGIFTKTSGSCTALRCPFPATTGISTTEVTTTGATPQPLSCNTGYSGNVTYTCNNGQPAVVTGSCTQIKCSAAAATGFTAKSNLAYAESNTGTFPCDVAGYTGNINYTCTASGAAFITQNTCLPIKCNASGVGYNKTNLAYTTNSASTGHSFSCNSGYTGTISYSCTSLGAGNTNGTATILSGSCSPICSYSATGFASRSNITTGSYSCDSGYSGTLNLSCTTPGGTATLTSGSCTNYPYPSQCNSYISRSFDDTYVGYGSGNVCHSGLGAGWYRLAGLYPKLQEQGPYLNFRGNSHAPGFMQFSHPSTSGQTVSGTVGFNWGSTTAWTTSIQVTNCGPYFVYYLPPAPVCNLVYVSGY